ncbi:hypothetical protein PRK78_004292 [Emydomyces testavorans]|uniref:Uncharacterized protein n=1 Tax=Emydomyces testavorans TaxID=2070801 RepID=A0AAF0DHK4_9EURO|nr:hypothetical protein PRK78_004292 [Emydomyces testavorans]
MSSKVILNYCTIFGLRAPRRELTRLTTRFRCLSTRSSIPRIAEPSVWTAMIPKFIRRDWRASQWGASKTKERNPATYFIVMFILVGSQALRMVQIKNDHANYVRSTEAKIRVLREVIERLQKGEDVDVRKMLGTGNEAAEREWEDVLEEIVQEEEHWRSRTRESESRSGAPPEVQSPNDSAVSKETAATDTSEQQPKKRAARFY